MRLTVFEKDILAEMANKFPLPSPLDEDARRAWTMKLAQTLRARIGDKEWGTKRADPNRPLSKDVVAFQAGSTLWGFDVMLGSGPLVPDPEGMDITGQVFVPVTPFDFLAEIPVDPVDPPPVTEGEWASREEFIALKSKVDQLVTFFKSFPV